MTSQAAGMGTRAVGERPFPDRPEGTDTLPQIDHILILMMENHTYDNWLGMLGRGPGQQPRGDGFTIGPDGLLLRLTRDQLPVLRRRDPQLPRHCSG